MRFTPTVTVRHSVTACDPWPVGGGWRCQKRQASVPGPDGGRGVSCACGGMFTRLAVFLDFPSDFSLVLAGVAAYAYSTPPPSLAVLTNRHVDGITPIRYRRENSW